MPRRDEVLSLFDDGSLLAKGERGGAGGRRTPRDERDDEGRLKNSDRSGASRQALGTVASATTQKTGV